jgi:uncharacterized protein
MKGTLLSVMASLLLTVMGAAWADEFQDLGLPSPGKKSEKEKFEACHRDAQRGDAKAQALLGLMYEEGVGTPKDYAEALHWLQLGARKGDATAQNNLGVLYFKGLGVKEDDGEALQWFQRAAGQGLASAQGNLGLMYGRGQGTPKDYAKALEWFKKAAEQNDVESQINLATLYSLGEGSPKNYIESHKWFSLALKNESLQGDQVGELRDNIEWLEKRMTGKEIAEAKKRASEWNPSIETGK